MYNWFRFSLIALASLAGTVLTIALMHLAEWPSDPSLSTLVGMIWGGIGWYFVVQYAIKEE